jgi:glutamate--cysteine ligase
MNHTSGYAEMLRTPFTVAPGSSERVGVEIELGVVRPDTGVSLPYGEPNGVATLLAAIGEAWGCTAQHADGALVGLARPDGVEISLESGCAVEYVSVPKASLSELVAGIDTDCRWLATIADNLGMALLTGSILPFDGPEDVQWAPKPRIPIMLEYFDQQVGPGSQGWAAMSQILSVQVTLDYLDDDDLARKFRMMNAVSPAVAAMFVNSPLRGGRGGERLSERMHVWMSVDPRRVGTFAHSLRHDFRVDDLVSWLLDLPPIFRHVSGGLATPPVGRTFRSLLAEGYGDGSVPTLEDWTGMLASTWPYVRLRRTLELRVADALALNNWAALPALWVGLAYDRRSCDDAWNLMRGFRLGQHSAAMTDIARNGLRASIGGKPILELCRELLAISREGLRRRVAYGQESPYVVTLLDPLEEIIDSELTSAEQLMRRWLGPFRQDPARYVEALRLRGN